jgi:predicted nucleic acid-binding protein
MTAIFADTYYFLALMSREDAAHQRAVTLSQSLTAPIVTTAWVLTEVADALASPARRARFPILLRTLHADPKVTIIPPTQALFEQGIELYVKRPDKEWSLTDCISFVVMQDAGIYDALTGDHHFEQAGFRALLK